MSDQNRDREEECAHSPSKIMADGDVVMSVEIDGARDHEWFRQNPLATERRRLATAHELAMFERMPGTMIRIVRDPPGMLHRIFPRRDQSRN